MKGLSLFDMIFITMLFWLNFYVELEQHKRTRDLINVKCEMKNEMERSRSHKNN